MTLGMIEGVLLMGMMGLIWMMLDISAGDDHADDKRQEDASPDHHYRMHQPLRSSPALEKPEVMVSLSAALIERLQNAAYWRGNPALADLVTHAIEDSVTQMEEIKGETFPQCVSPFKREALTRRARSSLLQ
ncbi:MAG: hypothetical protein AABY96_00400 [Nitrospirota bacterium]